MDKDNGFYISWKSLGKEFDHSIGSMQRQEQAFLKKREDTPLSSGGRPRKLSALQQEEVFKWIEARERQNQPPEPVVLASWISSHFGVDVSESWVSSWVKSLSSTPFPLYIVNAFPLDSSRAGVTSEQMRTWAAMTTPLLDDIHPSFCFNVDESSDQPRAEAKIKRVVSTKAADTTYEVTRADGHVTFLAGIGLDGKKLRTLVIVQTKTIAAELSQFGLPDNDHALITTSPSAYINEELFIYWLEKIWIPHIEGLRRWHNKPNQKALLLLDGATAHVTSVVRALFEKSNTLVIELPLDVVIFAAWKSLKGYTTIPVNIENKQALRMLKNLKALDRATDFITIQNAWAKAGWSVDRSGTEPKIVLDIEKVLRHDQAPVGDSKVDAEKKKRIAVFEGLNQTDRKRKADTELRKKAKKLLKDMEQAGATWEDLILKIWDIKLFF